MKLSEQQQFLVCLCNTVSMKMCLALILFFLVPSKDVFICSDLLMLLLSNLFYFAAALKTVFVFADVMCAL